MAYTYYKIAEFSGGWHDGEIGVEVASQSISGNYSTLNLVLRVRETTNASSYNLGGADLYISVDGSVKVTDDTIDFRSFATGTWYTILSKTGVVVNHGTDGKKTISVKGYCATGVGAGTYNQTQSIALPDIPRKSSISALTSTVEVNGTNQVTVSISRAVSTFKHTVLFSIGSYSQSYTNVDTSQSFAIPMSWLNAIPNAPSGVATCRVTTFDGTTNLGYVEDTFAITVPSTVIPVVTDVAFSKDTSGSDPFSAGVYVKGISKIKVTGISVTNQYSATVQEYKSYIHRSTVPYTDPTSLINTGASFISALLMYTGTIRLTEIVTDSRGYKSAAYNESITAYDYFAPTLSLTAFRCNSVGVADPSGEYLSATMTVNVAPVNNDNTHGYVLEFKKTTDSTWTQISTAALTGYSGTLTAVRAASAANTWEVRATVTDKVNSVVKATSVTTKRVGINVGLAGLAVAIGKMAEAEGLEVTLASKFNSTVEISGALTAPVAAGSQVGLVPAPGTTHTNQLLNVNASNQLEYRSLGSILAEYVALTSSTLAGDDILPIADVSGSNAAKKVTLDSVFAFLRANSPVGSLVVNASDTATINTYLTVDADWTINTLVIYKWGAFVSLYLNCTRGTALGVGNITNDPIATLKSSVYFPTIITSWCTASSGDIVTGYIDQAGLIGVSATRNGGTALNFGVTYLT